MLLVNNRRKNNIDLNNCESLIFAMVEFAWTENLTSYQGNDANHLCKHKLL